METIGQHMSSRFHLSRGECAHDTGSLHLHLDVLRQVVFGPHPLVELGHDC